MSWVPRGSDRVAWTFVGESNVSGDALPVSMGVVYVATCHLA